MWESGSGLRNIVVLLSTILFVACGSEQEDTSSNRLLAPNSTTPTTTTPVGTTPTNTINQTYFSDFVIALQQSKQVMLIAQVSGLCTITNGNSNVTWSLSPSNAPIQLTNQLSSCAPTAKLTANVPASEAFIIASLPRPDGKIDVLKFRLRQRSAPQITAPATPNDINANFCAYTKLNNAAGVDSNVDGAKMRFVKQGNYVYFRDGARICGQSNQYLGGNAQGWYSTNRIMDFTITINDPSPVGASLSDFAFTGSCDSTPVAAGQPATFSSSGGACENYCPFDFEFQAGATANQKKVIVRFRQDGSIMMPHTVGAPTSGAAIPHLNIAGGGCWSNSTPNGTPVHIKVTAKSAGGVLSVTKEIATLKTEIN